MLSGISPPLLPEVRGLLGVADYNSAFRLFFIPQQFRIWSETEVCDANIIVLYKLVKTTILVLLPLTKYINTLMSSQSNQN